jgi:hypothetical protein
MGATKIFKSQNVVELPFALLLLVFDYDSDSRAKRGSMFGKVEIRAVSFTLAAVLGSLGCGDHRLTSVTVSPASAVSSTAGGKVQFTATGTYSDSSKPVVLQQQVAWCVGSSSGMCNGNIAAAASVDGRGLAQCVSAGTVTILAGTGQQPMMPDVGQQLQVFGTARLTCP